LNYNEILQRNNDLEKKIKENCLQAIDVSADGNCFYRAVSVLVSGNESYHNVIRQSVASLIESRGNILNGLIQSSEREFKSYITSLRTIGKYDFVGEDTVLAVAELYDCEVHIYRSSLQPSVFRSGNGNGHREPIRLAFFEPAHYMALKPLPSASFQSLN
jgi:OTU-like cysteine protease